MLLPTLPGLGMQPNCSPLWVTGGNKSARRLESTLMSWYEPVSDLRGTWRKQRPSEFESQALRCEGRDDGRRWNRTTSWAPNTTRLHQRSFAIPCVANWYL